MGDLKHLSKKLEGLLVHNPKPELLTLERFFDCYASNSSDKYARDKAKDCLNELNLNDFDQESLKVLQEIRQVLD